MPIDVSLLPQTVWFFDYDGSVCPHTEVWEERTYDAMEIHSWVRRLAGAVRGLYWNTGRRPESLAGVYSGFREFPGYYVQGSVWCDRDGEPEVLGPLLDPKVAQAYQELIKGFPHLRLEIKKTGLRVAPVGTRNLKPLKSFLAQHSSSTPSGWIWHQGHRGAELLAKGFDKSVALVRELPKFPPGTIPVVVGDDSLDRPAFEEALRCGGYAVPVGDDCGWITEIPHRAHQIVFCETPTSTQELVLGLLRGR